MEKCANHTPVQLELFKAYSPQNSPLVSDNQQPLPDKEHAKWTMHEFFAGSGMASYGLKGMFIPIWANDISEKKAAVYQANFKSNHFILDDICNIHGKDLPFAHLSWASFPCQDLSLAGSIAGIHAARSGLIWEWMRVFDELVNKPKIIIMENVIGLVSAHNGDNYRAIHNALLKRGFACGCIAINANKFVPQSRPRVFIIAVEHSCSISKSITSNAPCWLHNDAIIKLGRTLPEWIWWNVPEPSTMPLSLQDIIDETVPYNKDDVLKLIPNKHWEELLKHDSMIATGYRRTRQGKQQLELRFDGIAGCLRTPEGGSSKQFVIVKKGNEIHARLLTTREAARLMGAPESFLLPGSDNDGYKAMGDAVVAPVVHFLGTNILKILAETIYTK